MTQRPQSAQRRIKEFSVDILNLNACFDYDNPLIPMTTAKDTYTGGCLCGKVRYECHGPQLLRGLCLCRTCQKISGGGGNFYMAIEAQGFRFTKGEPKVFTDQTHPWRPTRHFCGTCGVHLTARSERAPSGVLIKVGTLDDPSVFAGPQMVTWTSEMQKFHFLPPDVPAHPEIPGKRSDGSADQAPSA